MGVLVGEDPVEDAAALLPSGTANAVAASRFVPGAVEVLSADSFSMAVDGMTVCL